jgi:small-conductance mechanosensitive channel
LWQCIGENGCIAGAPTAPPTQEARMTEFFSAARWSELWNELSAWVLANVWSIDNAIQLAVAVFAFAAAMLLGRRLKPWLLALHVSQRRGRIIPVFIPLVTPTIWLLIQWLCLAAAASLDWPSHLLSSIASLLAAWIAIRLAAQIVTQPIWAKVIAWVAWSIAALNILGLLAPVIEVLDRIAFNAGDLRISLLTVAESTLAFVVLISLAVYVSGVLEARISSTKALSPSVQVLFAKAFKTVLIGLAILVSLRVVGIDLTALTVFGGAVGLGVGFGLQKIVSNLISGVILLVDKSIKPGDVIAVSGTYGWVTALGGRYVSVVTRDGIEHLIPNETLISERVENWTHTSNRTRLKIDVGVHYNSDVRQVMDLCIEAAKETPRVLEDPDPKCLLIAFGDNSVNLQLRIWIADAQNGVQNVKSAVLLNVWDKFQASGIQIPYPQRDVHLHHVQPPVQPPIEPPPAS